MKKVTLFSTALIASALVFSGLGATAQADQAEEPSGAKTVWGEYLPSSTDPDGDGWANVGFDPTWMTQESQDKINDLADQRQSGVITQVKFNEAVADIFASEQNKGIPDGYNDPANEPVNDNNDETPITEPWTEEKLADLALNNPEKLNEAPLHDVPYNYNFTYDNREFFFSYDGNEWSWSYEDKVLTEPTDEAYLAKLALHNPEVLDEAPLHNVPYDFNFKYGSFDFHFDYDGTYWNWSYDVSK